MDMTIMFVLLGLLLVTYAVMDFMKAFQKDDSSKLQDRLKGNLKTREQVQEEKQSLLKLDRDQAKTLVDQLIGRFQFVDTMQQKLDQADVDMRASSVLTVTAVVTLAVLVGGLVAGMNPIVAFALACLPFPAVFYFVGSLVRRRRNKFVEQMPDAFELMVQSLRAGQALAGAIEVVGQQAPDPIGKEFARVYAEQNLGKRLEDALMDMARRIDAMDVKFFVSAVAIQRQTGGDLAEVLDKIATLIRERIELYGTVKALTAEGKLSGYVLLSLPPVCLIFITMTNYEYIKPLYEETLGKFMLLAAGISMLLGMAMIKKIVTIEV